MMTLATDAISLADWRRMTAELYAGVRGTYDPVQAWAEWIDGRDQMFKEHSQTPLPAGPRRDFRGLAYFPYDKRLRTTGRIDYDVDREIFRVELEQDGLLQYQRIATIHFRFDERPLRLSLFWILGYGGGLFLPFKDATSGGETFAGGRYLYDTIKGADLGAHWSSILLDFNFAYNPSCAYSAKWVCPLAPQENDLPVAIEAGEKMIK